MISIVNHENTAEMDFSKVFQNNREWVEEKLSHNPNYFIDLAKGQHPELLYIGCSAG